MVACPDVAPLSCSRRRPMALTQRRLEANRRNAARSTGPRTANGKAWSRLNALKHGILASQAVITTIEGSAERKLFEATVAGLAQDFQPVGTYEQLLVQEIAACFWRKRRLLIFENRAAFDAIELPAAAIVDRGTDQIIPWKDPLYTQGAQLTTADQIYKQAGLDSITLPNEKDTLRVIRYEAAINRTRERALRSLREVRKERGQRALREPVAPAVDRAAARRNATSAQAKILSPWFTIGVWKRFREEQEHVILEEEMALRAGLQGRARETDQTKPKTLTPEEKDRRLKRSLYEVFGIGKPPEESETGPRDAQPDPDQPRSS
jgi:hypothetical protein